jgi:acetyl esterase/lipase
MPTASLPTAQPPTPTATIVPMPQGPLLTPAPTPEAFGKVGVVQRQVHYCTDGAEALRMDVYIPNTLKSDPAPIVVNTGIRLAVLGELLKRGYVVAALSPRHPSEHKLPIALYDVKCAVRYLRAKAGAYHVDPNRIGVWGCSRAGYLAALLGLTDADSKLEGPFGFEDQPSRVQAVVVMDGIANWRTWLPSDRTSALGELDAKFGINSFDDPIIDRTSPVTYISNDDPPFLIIVSESDNETLPGEKSQMQELYDALNAGGVAASWVVVKNAFHCFENSSNMDPSPKQMAQMVVDFFDRNLK